PFGGRASEPAARRPLSTLNFRLSTNLHSKDHHDAPRPNISETRKERRIPPRCRRLDPSSARRDDQCPGKGPIPDHHRARAGGPHLRSVVPGYRAKRRRAPGADHHQCRALARNEKGSLRANGGAVGRVARYSKARSVCLAYRGGEGELVVRQWRSAVRVMIALIASTAAEVLLAPY